MWRASFDLIKMLQYTRTEREMSSKSNNSANDSAEILDADFGNRVE